MFRKIQNSRFRQRKKRRERKATLQRANSIMLKLFEIEDETPATAESQASAHIDQVTLPSGISVNLPVSWCVSNQSDSERTFGWEDSSNAEQSRPSFGLENVSDSPPRRSLVHEDFESNEFIVTSEEICF